MAQRKTGKRERQTQIALVTRPDNDTLVLRTFWSPLPNWIYGTVGAALIAGIAALVGVAGGASTDTIQTLVLIGALVGYFGSAIGWAIAGVAGGDVQEIRFDLREDVARVRQSLLWTWRRNWSFEIDEVYRLHVWPKRGRFIFKLSLQEIIDLTFTDDDDSSKLPPLNLGRYPTEIEGMRVAEELATFLGIPIKRQPPES